MHGLDMPRRASWTLFLLLTILSASLCYSYLFSIVLPIRGLDNVNITLFAVPVALAVLLLGAPRGALLAFATGVLVMYRARWTAITLFEDALCDPCLSVAGLVVGSALMAAVFFFGKVADAIGPPWEASPLRSIGRRRLVWVACGCVAFSLAFSLLSRGVVYLFALPGANNFEHVASIREYLEPMWGPWIILEAVLNAVVLFGSCVAALVTYARMVSGTWRLSLAATFRRATDEADSELRSELSYLMAQLDERGDEDAASIVRDYRSAFGGTVYAVRDLEIVASNDPTEVGRSALWFLQVDSVDRYEHLLEFFLDGLVMSYDIEAGELLGIRALKGDTYTLFLEASLSSVFRARLATLRYTGAFLLLIFVAVFFVVHLLLRRIVVEPIGRTNETLARIGAGELHRRVNERAVAEFDALSDGINATVSALRDTIDLATARVIQESALPREFPPFPDVDRFDLFASMRPAREVGGDFYDFFRTGESGLVFLVADVSGKGISAALFMMRAKTQVKNNIMAGMPLEAAITAANHQLCLGNDAGMFVTLFCCQLDFETGELAYVNAGHNPPVLDHGGNLEWIKKKSGLPLGLYDGIKYKRFERTLEAGDLLFLYTDGVNEAFSADQRAFGDDAILEQLGRTHGTGARSACAGMRLALAEFTAGAEQSDDITMLALVFGVPPEPRATVELAAEVGQLAHVQHLVQEELHRRGAPPSAAFALDVAVEELFVNVCEHAYPDAAAGEPGDVRVECAYDAGSRSLSVTLVDEGVPFDPLAHLGVVEGDPTVGLGIRLAARSVDRIAYERKGGRNVCTVTKGW